MMLMNQSVLHPFIRNLLVRQADRSFDNWKEVSGN